MSRLIATPPITLEELAYQRTRLSEFYDVLMARGTERQISNGVRYIGIFGSLLREYYDFSTGIKDPELSPQHPESDLINNRNSWEHLVDGYIKTLNSSSRESGK